MRKLVIALLALGLIAIALPALALDAARYYSEEGGQPGPGGGPTRSNDCLGDIVWDTGMTDDFTPPTGCSSAASAGCFVNAINDGGFPQDGRRLADDWIADTRPITGIKIWARYNAQGYDYHAQNPGSIHGFCVKFYEAADDPPFCPDGTIEGETAIGQIVYDQYVTNFVEYEIPGFLPRNFNYCITLPTPFQPALNGHVYWVSASADFDFTSFEDGVTQWFTRLTPGAFGGYSPYCEATWWDAWSDPPLPWQPVSQGVGLPCWAGWEEGFVLYSNITQVPGACCNPATGECTLVMQDQCLPPLVWNGAASCDPNPCPPVPVEQKTWGGVKNSYR